MHTLPFTSTFPSRIWSLIYTKQLHLCLAGSALVLRGHRMVLTQTLDANEAFWYPEPCVTAIATLQTDACDWTLPIVPTYTLRVVIIKVPGQGITNICMALDEIPWLFQALRLQFTLSIFFSVLFALLDTWSILGNSIHSSFTLSSDNNI